MQITIHPTWTRSHQPARNFIGASPGSGAAPDGTADMCERSPNLEHTFVLVLDSHRHLQMYLHLHSFALQSTTLKYHASAPFVEKVWDCTYHPSSITVLLVVDWAFHQSSSTHFTLNGAKLAYWSGLGSCGIHQKRRCGSTISSLRHHITTR